MQQSAQRAWMCVGLGALLIIINPIRLGLLAFFPWSKARVIFEDRWEYAKQHGLGLAWVLRLTR